MAIIRILDTNVLLYHLGGRLHDSLLIAEHAISVITELEVLSYPSLTTEEELAIQELLSTITVVGLTPEVKEQTIALRRARKLKLADAIICATALALNAELVTNDTRLLALPEVSTSSPKLKR